LEIFSNLRSRFSQTYVGDFLEPTFQIPTAVLDKQARASYAGNHIRSKFQLHQEVEGEGKASSALLPGLSVELAAIFL